MLETVGTGVLLTLVVLAAARDVRTGRIPNQLIVAGVAAALVLRAAAGWGALLDGLLGLGLGLVVFFPLFALRAMGGGDVKLVAMACAFLGPERGLVALLATAVAGGVMALAAAWRQRVLLPVLFGSGEVIRHWATLGRSGNPTNLASPGATSIPYGVAIAVGAAVACVL